jgi:hypothetical protein
MRGAGRPVWCFRDVRAISLTTVALSESEFWEFKNNADATKSERRVQSLSEAQVDGYIDYFIDIHPKLTHPWMFEVYEDRIKRLRKEKDRRSTQRQHEETIGVAKQNIRWVILIGILAIAVPLLIAYCPRSSPTVSQKSSPAPPLVTVTPSPSSQ